MVANPTRTQLSIPILGLVADHPITLPLECVRTDASMQARASMDPATVKEYAEFLQNGGILPPILVFWDEDAYWVVDGWHRLEAHRQAGHQEIQAIVKQGSRRDAILAAVGANAHHGLRRSNSDKRRAVTILLQDDEWANWSDGEISRRTSPVSHLSAKCAGNWARLKTVLSQTRATGLMVARSIPPTLAKSRANSEPVSSNSPGLFKMPPAPHLVENF